MDWGMKNRLSRLIKPDGHCFFMPIDHGYFQGPTSCLEKPAETIKPIIQYCDGLFVTRGVLRAAIIPELGVPIILRVSGARWERTLPTKPLLLLLRRQSA
jgi:putative autoinducer-2 (AI-2) aldolase